MKYADAYEVFASQMFKRRIFTSYFATAKYFIIRKDYFISSVNEILHSINQKCDVSRPNPFHQFN